MERVHLPVRPSKIKCLILAGYIVFLYLLENSNLSKYIDVRVVNYLIKPVLWLGLALLVWVLPRIRAKGKQKFKSFLCFWAFNFAVIYIIIYVFAGFFIDGFGKSPYSRSVAGMATNILLVGSMLAGREMARSYIVNTLAKAENYIIFVLIALFMAFADISLNRLASLKDFAEILQYSAQYIIPDFAKNLMATYISFLGGPLPAMIYMGTIEAFNWLSPILPNLRWITQALVGILTPVFCLMVFQNMYLRTTNKVKTINQKKEKPLGWIITSIISISIVWFAVGVFPIYPSVIATGSMEPGISPGDVIVAEKINGKDAEVGDIIQYKSDTILISHRVIDVVENDQGRFYQTKGDNNSAPDPDLIRPEQIKGRVKFVVPKIGWPSLLFKTKSDVPLDKVQF